MEKKVILYHETSNSANKNNYNMKMIAH